MVLSMKDKFIIAERLQNGECVTKLAQDYGVGKSTISGLKKQNAAIESHKHRKLLFIFIYVHKLLMSDYANKSVL
jgi:hypothetical protein